MSSESAYSYVQPNLSDYGIYALPIAYPSTPTAQTMAIDINQLETRGSEMMQQYFHQNDAFITPNLNPMVNCQLESCVTALVHFYATCQGQTQDKGKSHLVNNHASTRKSNIKQSSDIILSALSDPRRINGTSVPMRKDENVVVDLSYGNARASSSLDDDYNINFLDDNDYSLMPEKNSLPSP